MRFIFYIVLLVAFHFAHSFVGGAIIFLGDIVNSATVMRAGIEVRDGSSMGFFLVCLLAAVIIVGALQLQFNRDQKDASQGSDSS